MAQGKQHTSHHGLRPSLLVGCYGHALKAAVLRTSLLLTSPRTSQKTGSSSQTVYTVQLKSPLVITTSTSSPVNTSLTTAKVPTRQPWYPPDSQSPSQHPAPQLQGRRRVATNPDIATAVINNTYIQLATPRDRQCPFVYNCTLSIASQRTQAS